MPLDRLILEYGMLKHIVHPNIISVYGYLDRPEPTILMEYFPEGSMVDAGQFSKKEYVSALGQVLAGLGHLHNNGIVHGDVKEANFLVRRSPLFTVVIADFGSAARTLTAVDRADHNLLGTTYGALRKDLMADVYSWGPDVLALGTVAIRWFYGFPEPSSLPMFKEGYGPSFCETDSLAAIWTWSLFRRLQEQPADKINNVLRHVVEPVHALM